MRFCLKSSALKPAHQLSRIARQTGFNGLKVLDGSLGEFRLQGRANLDTTIMLAVNGGDLQAIVFEGRCWF